MWYLDVNSVKTDFLILPSAFHIHSMVINYNSDRGFWFFGYMIPDPQLPSNLFECTPLAMTFETA